jgi:hypothetical protein
MLGDGDCVGSNVLSSAPAALDCADKLYVRVHSAAAACKVEKINAALSRRGAGDRFSIEKPQFQWRESQNGFRKGDSIGEINS